MLENIKSSYFIKIIFSFLNEKTKLKLLKYNKCLQNIMNINLINYKISSGRYIVREENGNIKEYSSYDDELLFEGEYLNGERNGKGKEYDWLSGKLTFEGEYLNGKRNGKGKEYNKEGNLIFDGEYLHGKRWNGKGYDDKNNIIYELKNGKGHIKEYDYFGAFIFEGEYLNGERNGKGKEYDFYDGKLIFEGEYLNGKRNGTGKEYDYFDGHLIFEGKYLYGRRWDGKVYDNKNNIYELKNGTGLIKQYDEFGNLSSEKNYIKGKINGIEKIYSGKKVLYEIECINGILIKKKEYNKDGLLMYEYEYLYEKKIKGKDYLKGKLEYEGEYLFDRKYNGKGYDENGNIIYEIINGNGKVKEYDKGERLTFDGEYLNGRRWNGIFRKYDLVGTILNEEEYKNGEKIKLK